jgi:membrane protein
MTWVTRLDHYQRRHSWVGMPLAVAYKYIEDQGGYLAVLITYYAFLSLFPLLLLLISILGFVLEGDRHLQQQALHSALRQFPVIGQQIGDSVNPIHGSIAAVIAAVIGTLYGGTGVAQAMQHALNTVWAVPKDTRPNPLRSRLRSLVLLLVLGTGLLATTVLSALATSLQTYLGGNGAGRVYIQIGAGLVGAAVNVVLFVVTFRLLTARQVTTAQVRVGAMIAGIGWQVLQLIGTYFISHQLRGASASYGVFGTVLGIFAFLYVAAVLVVFCAEANVVRSKKLWPRSLLSPFADDVSLNSQDRRTYTSYATSQRNKSFEEINVDFHNPPSKNKDSDATDTSRDQS